MFGLFAWVSEFRSSGCCTDWKKRFSTKPGSEIKEGPVSKSYFSAQAYYQRTSRAGSGDSENGSRDPSFKPPPQPTPPEGMADTSGDFLSSSCKTLDNREFDAEVTQLMLEVDAYRLMSHFFWGIWAVVQSQISDIKFGYLDYALVRFEHYFLHKKELLDCKTFVSLESS